MAKTPFRFALARAILGTYVKDFISGLDPFGDGLMFGSDGRLNDYANKQDQLKANLGWCYAASAAIADPTSAVELGAMIRIC